ncbi:alpha-catulin isoform X2 [Crotalus tigris]|uniref:alpha-catulin isoform X2 n=1 Tax=Crotalus tigris TaxID=88082 RepID=UPI00192F9E63|nr:alpha-catulin isoform X2 [Crotalus tigris]
MAAFPGGSGSCGLAWPRSPPASALGWEPMLGLQIRSRSVEQTLVPLVAQITTLINHKDKPKKSDKTLKAVQQVGQAVNLAVGKFVMVGEAIAKENQELKEEMKAACTEAKQAGETIAQLTDIATLDRPESDGQITIFTDKTGVVKAARLLLSSVTKVLVLADIIVIKQIIASRNKVLKTMEQLEKVSSFQEFVQIFSQFGNEMVEFAHLTGDRQNDLKDEKKKAKMAAARSILEKCTMMLLTASKTCLRHPDCESARVNKGAVFHRMRLALEQVIEIVADTRPNGENESGPMSIYNGIKEFKNKVEGLRENLYLLPRDSLRALLRLVLELTEDFTDSAYTSHETRGHILELSKQAKMELEQLVSAWINAQNQKKREITEDLEISILKMCQCMNELQRELHSAAISVAADLIKYHSDHLVLKALKACGAEGNIEAIAEHSYKLSEQKDQLIEICHLLRHVSGTEPLEITCLHAEDTFHVTGPQIISAAETLTLHPSSKIAKENLDVFCEAWESQLNDMSLLLREISDVFEGRRGSTTPGLQTGRNWATQVSEAPSAHARDSGSVRNHTPWSMKKCPPWNWSLTPKGEKRAYLSLPKPGKHNANLKALKPVRLDNEEQTKLGKLGLELHKLTTRVDSEMEKWEDPENEIIRYGQGLSSMAYSMYLFTRGEGLLKITQDLFHQAEAFAIEGLKLTSALHIFSSQLEDDDKPLLLQEIERMVSACQQLQVTAKAPVQGKTATHLKVDTCVQKAKYILDILSQVLPLSFRLLRKQKAGNGYLMAHCSWNGQHAASRENSGLAGSTNTFGIKSLEQHVASLTVLENK